MSSTTINYAELAGINSVGAAAVFLAVYLPLTGWFVFQSVKRLAAVYILMVLFCLMRTGAFLIRALMAKPGSTASTNMTASIVDQILFNAGFFALLYGAFGTVLDRCVAKSLPLILPAILTITYSSSHIMAGGKRYPRTTLNPLANRIVFHILLSGAIIVGVVGSVRNIRSANDPDSDQAALAKKLRKISTLILFLLAALQLTQSILFFRQPRRGDGTTLAPAATSSTLADPRGPGRVLLIIISKLLIVRQLFLLATIDHTSKANQESLWYPLVAVPELLVALMFALPGLVPVRKELKAVERERREANAESEENYKMGMGVRPRYV
ncbi:hypothetical protein MKEN_00156900 [Mycena kentingensis (nom. inval.)]|nr:hypothetical protein MKEN_00156900 [Mycena kentingensis (nom. inval.)]